MREAGDTHSLKCLLRVVHYVKPCGHNRSKAEVLVCMKFRFYLAAGGERKTINISNRSNFGKCYEEKRDRVLRTDMLLGLLGKASLMCDF